MRVHVCAVRMTLHRAAVLEAYLNGQDIIQKATVYERTGDVVLTYRGSRKDAAALLDWAVGAFSIGSAPCTEQPAAAVPLRWCEESGEAVLYPAAALDGLLLCSDTPYTLEAVDLPEQLEAPVAAGQQFRQVNLVQNAEVLGTVPREVRQKYARSSHLY